MRRNIKRLHYFDPPVSAEEVRAAAFQFVREISGLRASKANERPLYAAVDDISEISGRLLRSLDTKAPPKNRDEEAAKAKALFERSGRGTVAR